jgi:uncharacterized membrane protein
MCKLAWLLLGLVAVVNVVAFVMYRARKRRQASNVTLEFKKRGDTRKE